MKNLEAVAGNVLIPVAFDIVLEELIGCLVCLDWVAQVIIIDLFLVVSQEASNCFDARCTLKILAVEHFL